MTISLCACKEKIDFSINDLDAHQNTIVTTFSFSKNDESDSVTLVNGRIKGFQEMLSGTSVEYGTKNCLIIKKH